MIGLNSFALAAAKVGIIFELERFRWNISTEFLFAYTALRHLFLIIFVIADEQFCAESK